MKIPFKIFGVAILVFAIMTSVIAYSTYKVYEVGLEVKDIAEVFIPLSNKLSVIEHQVINQELHVERLEKHFLEVKLIDEEIAELNIGIVPKHLIITNKTPADAIKELNHERTSLLQRIESEEKDFVGREVKVDNEIKLAEKMVADAVNKTATAEGKLALRTLLPLLKAVDIQHSNLHAQQEILIKAFKQDSSIRYDLEKLIEQEEEELTLHMEEAWEKIAHFTQQAAITAEAHERQVLVVGITATGFAGLLSLVLSILLIRNMVRPLNQLLSGVEQVESGDLSTQLQISTTDELADLTRSFNGMVEGLRKAEKIKDTFGQYVDPRVVSGLIGDHSRELVKGEKKIVSVFFSDLQNFTAISERFTPGGVVKMINHYLAMMSDPITNNKGLIDKYIGDAIMAFWCMPFCEDGEQASLAVGAALVNLKLMKKFQEDIPELVGLRHDIPIFAVRIGISTGEAIVGSIGSEKTKNFTVMGDSVNIGARLEGANKVYGTSILVCERTFAMASAHFEFRKIDRLIVKGKTEPLSIYEPLAPISCLSAKQIKAKNIFEKAFAAYHEGDWRTAIEGFEDCLKLNNNDKAAATYVRRITILQRAQTHENWDGIWRMETK